MSRNSDAVDRRVREEVAEALDDLAGRLATCAAGVARATGTTVAVEGATIRYEHFRDSGALSERFAAHLDRAVIRPTLPAPGEYLDRPTSATSAPAFRPSTPLPRSWTRTAPTTRPSFAAAAVSARARRVLPVVTEALACRAIDVLRDADLRERARNAHGRPTTGH